MGNIDAWLAVEIGSILLPYIGSFVVNRKEAFAAPTTIADVDQAVVVRLFVFYTNPFIH
jgi:hypothetical protein